MIFYCIVKFNKFFYKYGLINNSYFFLMIGRLKRGLNFNENEKKIVVLIKP